MQRLASVKQSTGLIKIHRLLNVRRNDAIVAGPFIDAVQLNGHQYRNAALIELIRELDHSRSTPAVSQQNDASILFLSGGELTIAVRIQPAHNLLVRLFPAATPVLNRNGAQAIGLRSRKPLHHLDLKMT